MSDSEMSSTCWLGWVGLGWVGLGWVGLGWVGLGWVGLRWVGLDSKRPFSTELFSGWILLGLPLIVSRVNFIVV